MGLVFARLASDGALRDGITVEEAAEIAWALASPHQYEYLVIDRGWSIERYREHLKATIAARLLSGHPRDASTEAPMTANPHPTSTRVALARPVEGVSARPLPSAVRDRPLSRGPGRRGPPLGERHTRIGRIAGQRLAVSAPEALDSPSGRER